MILLIVVVVLYTKQKVKDKACPPAELPRITSTTKRPPGEAHVRREYRPREKTPRVKAPHRTYRMAIVIDDLGYDRTQFEEFLQIDAPLTFSVFPSSPHSEYIAQEAHALGRDVMLHLPMEPHEFPQKNPGNGTLFLHMSDEELRSKLTTDLRSVPFIKGVNNHMGSKFTEDKDKMRVVLKELRKRNLFFLDSRTSNKSVAYSMAREMGVNVAGRNVFLDNNADLESTIAQIQELAGKAVKNGSAIGIAHPYPSTIEALQQTIPELKERGIEVVPVSGLVH